MVCNVLVGDVVWCRPSGGQGAELPMTLELTLSHAVSLWCRKGDLEGPFSQGCYNLGLATDSDNRGAN